MKEMDKYKDNLLATVSNYLKTQINCIIAFSKNALNSVIINDIKTFLKIIIKNAQL